MNKPHKWAKEIKAWADGAEIECRFLYAQVEQSWQVTNAPRFEDLQYEFRIKPQPKEPQYLYAYRSEDGSLDISYTDPTRVNLARWECIGKIKLIKDDE